MTSTRLEGVAPIDPSARSGACFLERPAKSEKGRDAFVDGLKVGSQLALGIHGRFVRRRDAGELLDLSSKRFFIETFRIAGPKHVDRALDKDLHERGVLLAAHIVADGAVGRDRGNDDGHAMLGEQFREKTEAPNVEIAVCF